MSTLIENLNAIYNAKKDIKTALSNKGQTVGDNILDYAGAINSISGGGIHVYRNWWKVYFIDYDGTVLSYQEVNDGDDFVFPDAPNHEDKWMRFTGWNQTSNHTSDYDPQDIYTIVIGAIYDVIDQPYTGENTKLMFNAHSLTMTTGFTLTSTVADGITIDWGDGTTTTSSSTSKTEYTHTYDRSYLGKDVTVEIQCADGNTYSFDKVKTGLDNIMPTNVKFGKGCTSISSNAFQNCYSLQSVSIPSSVTSIGQYSFYQCYNLKSVSIPSSMTSIGSEAFYQCCCMQSVTIPSSVTSIGDKAFYCCYSLQSVTIPSTVNYIGGSAFGGCYSLQSVSIPSSVTSIGSSSFSSCYPLIYNKFKLNNYNPNSIYNIVEIESSVGNGVFIKSINIPSSVTSIGSSSFSGCSSLQSVTIPSTVTSIGSDAFYQCYSLQSVTIPSTVTSIGSEAFYQCYSLKSVNIQSGVTNIGQTAFANCIGLQSVTIPSTVTSIGGSAFGGCRSLQSVNIQSGVTNIVDSEFSSCYSLQSVTIPSTVTSLGEKAFYDCYSLQSVTIPSGVKSIVNYIFQYCSSLQSVTIPSTVTRIGGSAFYQCYSLQSVSIPSSVTSIGGGAFDRTNCILDFGNERTTVPTISSTSSIGYNFCIVPDALYDQWCAATNWSTMTNKIVKYSDFHGSAA